MIKEIREVLKQTIITMKTSEIQAIIEDLKLIFDEQEFKQFIKQLQSLLKQYS